MFWSSSLHYCYLILLYMPTFKYMQCHGLFLNFLVHEWDVTLVSAYFISLDPDYSLLNRKTITNFMLLWFLGPNYAGLGIVMLKLRLTCLGFYYMHTLNITILNFSVSQAFSRNNWCTFPRNPPCINMGIWFAAGIGIRMDWSGLILQCIWFMTGIKIGMEMWFEY